ncbi:MAG: phosphatase PAP2 family protein [Acidobacteriota bacterium]|nr:phosphatase PAP2 family protein [Acidobacteriota bacterium]
MPDPILFWNTVALEANRVSHTNGLDEQTGPTRSSRALAIVHLAMYDAYAGVINDTANLPRYIAVPPSPAPGASPEAAVAAAAHATLSDLFPGQTPFFDLILAGAGDPSDPGHSFGIAVAQTILADRAGDPGGASPGYTPSPLRGKHRPDPDNPGQGFHGAFYGAQSKGFAITNRHELAAPPFDDNEYNDALREVRGRGIAPELMGALPNQIKARTVDQTLIGIFWAYDGVAELGTPPRLYNQIIRQIAMTRSPGSSTTPNSVAENARLFAFVNVAMADAGILAWDQKYIHDLWRPVVGIREHDQSMGPAATQADNNISNNCDSQWLPLGAPRTNRIGKNFTPPFPAYPSGHATFGAAAFHITRLFYGVSAGNRQRDDLFKDSAGTHLGFVSDEFGGISTDNKGTVRPRHLRNFPDGLWQMIEENGRSRVYLGVHWVFDAFAVKDDNTSDLARTDANGKLFGGVPLGLQIAEDIFQAGAGQAPMKSTTVPPRL